MSAAFRCKRARRIANDQRPATSLSAGLALRLRWFAGLSGSGLECGADGQIGGPAIGKDLPGAGGLPNQDNQIFAALFAALSHGDGDEHFATAEIESDLTQDFETQRFHLYVAQTGFKERDEEFANGGQTAHRRNAGADDSSVGSVKLEQIVDVPGVASLRPVLHHLAGARFGAAAR